MKHKPAIVLSAPEHHALSVLALAPGSAPAEDADNLLGELDRARVVEPGALPADAVRMGSRVTYRTNAGAEHTAALVYPGEADISANRVSVLTPVGTALLGLREGQSIGWQGRNGREHRLTVVRVEQPVAAS